MPRHAFGIDLPHKPTPPVGREGDHYAGFAPGTTLLPSGHRKNPRCRPLTSPTIFDRDVPIPTRDGTILRGDIFRPATSDESPVPALMVWSPYGKSGAGVLNLSFMPNRAGIPESALSGYEKFEGPDPAEWIPRGYAIVNLDARGVFDSEGDIRCLGSGEGEDGYDAVEHIAKLPWCTGSVALVGNSWLAMAAYHIAAQQPPSLKCFAPLEGASDFYRETLCRGGVLQAGFWYAIAGTFSGRGQTEDPAQVSEKYPDWCEYWEDKRVDFSKIRVPTYVLASFSTGLHTEGSVRCFEELDSAEKWLTFHDTQEWYDLYTSKRTEELASFFDHFLKGVDNGFEKTPAVRAALLGFNEPNMTDIVLKNWPASTTQYTKLFLSSNSTLSSSPPKEPSTTSYQSNVQAEQKDSDHEEVLFTHTFQQKTYLLGYSKASLYVSCPDHNDLDIFIQIRKASSNGQILRSLNIPLSALNVSQEEVVPLNILQYLGPTGICRASRRDLDEKLSKPYYPVPSLRKTEKVPPGDVVKLEIGIWPGGMIFEAGEKLVLKISGHPMILAEFPQLWGSHKTANKGKHVVHFGGETASYVQVPFVEL